MIEPITRIVLTGAPSSGKTEFFQRLKEEPEFSRFAFLEETARSLLEEDPGWRDRWHEFHLEIYGRQLLREQALSGCSFVTDRGSVDAFAFHPETMAKIGTTLEKEYTRYDWIIHLGSAAALGEDLYVQDEIRNEPLQAALDIEKKIAAVWSDHPGYRQVPAEPQIDTKYRRFLTLVTELAQKDNV